MNIKGENNRLDIKKEKLSNELSKRNPNMKILNRLKESIKRHKSIARNIKNKREKSKKLHGWLNGQ